MLKTRKFVAKAFVLMSFILLFLVQSYFFYPGVIEGERDLYFVALEFMLLVANLVCAEAAISRIETKLENKTLIESETAYLQQFMEAIVDCYSFEAFYEVVKKELERNADCSVVFVDSAREYILYSSADTITSDPKTIATLNTNFPEDWPDGYYFFKENLSIVSSYKRARGFMFSANNYHLFVFCRYIRLFDTGIYQSVCNEYSRFINRADTVARLSEVATLSRDLELLAENQRSFFPHSIPKIDRLSIAHYMRLSMNISSDYYDVIPIDRYKTLVLMGDVFSKGFGAAVMTSTIMSTIKMVRNKEDLVGIIKMVDQAIKSMRLKGRYTALFAGIIDTKEMTVRYINASMSEPYIITSAPDGYKLKQLMSNCPTLGNKRIDDISIVEQRLFRDDLILLSSDGLRTIANSDSKPISETELYRNMITENASKSPDEYIEAITATAFEYSGDTSVQDDITILAVKVTNL